jgi:hypothetical protein
MSACAVRDDRDDALLCVYEESVCACVYPGLHLRRGDIGINCLQILVTTPSDKEADMESLLLAMYEYGLNTLLKIVS